MVYTQLKLNPNYEFINKIYLLIPFLDLVNKEELLAFLKTTFILLEDLLFSSSDNS